MKWYTYIICFALVICGIFSTIELVQMFNIYSNEYGTAITIETQNNYNEVSKFDFGCISFDTTNYVNYSNVSTYDAVEFDGTMDNYVLLFNDKPLNNVAITNGRASGDTSIIFYDLNGDEITTATVNFVIEYFASQTKVTTTITNTNSSVSYLNAYMELNGAVLKVVSRGA